MSLTSLAIALCVAFGISAFVFALYRKSKSFPDFDQLLGEWEAVPAIDDNGHVQGYAVRWSKPGKDGKFLWVGHYYAGEGLSLAWCKNAAEGNARRLNEQCRVPWEYDSWRV